MLGQICCDSNGKLNAQSVLLEAGPEQGGQQVPVDLSELKEYSLFPGQVSGMIAVVVVLCTMSGGLSFTCALSCVHQVTWPPRATERAKELSCRLTQHSTENSDILPSSPHEVLSSLCEAAWQEVMNVFSFCRW